MLDAATAALAAMSADRCNAPTYDDRVRALRARYRHDHVEPPTRETPRLSLARLTRPFRIFQRREA